MRSIKELTTMVDFDRRRANKLRYLFRVEIIAVIGINLTFKSLVNNFGAY